MVRQHDGYEWWWFVSDIIVYMFMMATVTDNEICIMGNPPRYINPPCLKVDFLLFFSQDESWCNLAAVSPITGSNQGERIMVFWPADRPYNDG